MKKLLLIISLLMGCCAWCGAAGLERVKVGVFDPRSVSGRASGVDEALAILEKDVQLEVSSVSSINDLGKYSAVVFPCLKHQGEQPEDWKEKIKVYVKNGGGVVLVHDSCGRAWAMSPTLFPEIAVSDQRWFIKISKRGDERFFTVADQKHPVMAGVEKFVPSGLQFVILKKGGSGVSLMKVDGYSSLFHKDKKKPVIVDAAVAGEYGKGRVVMLANLPGYIGGNKVGMTGKLTPSEDRLLLNSVRWSAGADVESSGTGEGVSSTEQRALVTAVLELRVQMEKLKEELRETKRNLENRIELMNIEMKEMSVQEK